LAETDARHFRRDRAKRPANLRRSVRLGVERVNLTNGPVKIKQDDILRLAELPRPPGWTRRCPLRYQIRHAEPQEAARPCLQHFAARKAVAESFAGAEKTEHEEFLNGLA